jgi:chloramphenicol-sensitive protein RarD
VSLALAVSFAVYGYLRKTVAVGASPGLMVEAILLSPFAIAYLVFMGVGEGMDVTFLGDPGLLLLLVGTGAVTAVPLALFAAGARRLPLTVVGLLQYIAPTIQLFLALYIYGETISAIRLATFGLIWVSLAIFTVDALNRGRKARRAR